MKDNKREIIKVSVSSFKSNQKIEANAFESQTIMKENQKNYKNASASLPLYPVALMGSVLENEKVSTIDDTTNHILKFVGDKSFTIVETASSSKDDLDIEYVNSEMIDMINGFAYVQDNQMTYVSSGVVCSLYSNDLSQKEMLAVLSSMQSTQVK